MIILKTKQFKEPSSSPVGQPSLLRLLVHLGYSERCLFRGQRGQVSASIADSSSAFVGDPLLQMSLVAWDSARTWVQAVVLFSPR